MVRAFADGDLKGALRLHNQLYPLFKDLFVETNPVPVKAALALMGVIAEEYRLPLCPLSDRSREILTRTLQASGLI
jgi:4-hydroxy-tetrahydrodipicolinate synthase